jgi:hypothetical protein
MHRLPVKPAEPHSHAELAMKAARSVARARRRAQKEKMGRIVCHHLLRMLEPEETKPMGRARPPESREQKQISLGL